MLDLTRHPSCNYRNHADVNQEFNFKVVFINIIIEPELKPTQKHNLHVRMREHS